MRRVDVLTCLAVAVLGVAFVRFFVDPPTGPVATPNEVAAPSPPAPPNEDGPPLSDPLALDGPRLGGVAGWRADLELLREAIPRHWSYVEHRRSLCGVDVDKVVDDGLAALANDATERGFLLALRLVIAGLRDGHAGVALDGVPLQEPWRLPVHLMGSPNGVFVLGTTVALRTAGKILPGDVVTAIDGKPIEELITSQERITCASSDGARRVGALHDLPRSWSRARARFSLVRDGEALEVTVDVVPHDTVVGAPMRLYGDEVFDPGIAPGVAYWRPGPFTVTDDHRDFMARDQAGREAMTRAKRASYVERAESLVDHRAVIIDLRGNPGGTDMLGQVFASGFVPPESVYFKLQGRSESGRWQRPSEYRVPALPIGQKPFGGQVVLIVDERTFSTADNVAACLVDARDDVTVVGRHAGSGTGAPRPFTLPHSGAKVTFCTMRVWTADDRMIEGQGVVPDVEVRWSIEDWLDQGRDPDLDAALTAVR